MSAAAQAALVTHSADTDFTGAMSRIADENTTSSTQLISAYRELPADRATVGLWHMNEGSGTTAADSSGNGRTGTLVNGTAWNTAANSKLGSSSLSFDGINDVVTTADINSLDGTSQFTIESWVKMEGTFGIEDRTIVAKRNSAADGIILAWYNTNSQGFSCYVPASATYERGYTGSSGYTTGQWYHVTCAYNGGGASNADRLKIYINGIEKSLTYTGTIPATTTGNAVAVTIGELESGSNPFNGTIDEVRISNVARTPEEIMADAQRRPYGTYTSQTMNLGKVSAFNSLSWTEQGVQTGDGETLFNSTGLVAQWNFNETSGTLAKDSVSTFSVDTTGNLTNNLTAYWKLDEASGTRYDAKGGNNLTDQNTVTSNPGKQGNAGQFTAANSEYLNISDNADLSMGTSNITITAWVYFDSKPGLGPIVAKFAGSPNREYAIYYFGGATDKFGYCYDTSGNCVFADTPTPISTGQWYFIAAWKDTAAGTFSIQINNGTTYSVSATNNADTTQPFRIGGTNDSATDYFNGRIDEVGFWKRALTQQERTDLYNAGSGQSYSNSGTLVNFSSTSSQDQAAGTGWTSNNRRWGSGALMFDGTDDIVNVGNPAALQITGDITVELWVKTNVAANNNDIFARANDGTTISYIIDYISSSNYVGWRLSTDGTWTGNSTKITSGVAINDGNWHYVVGTRSGSTMNLYIDGVFKSTGTLSGNLFTGASNVNFGYNPINLIYFPGTIDSTRIYNRSLTAAEILSNYQAGQIEFQTRTSADNVTWEAWKPVTSEAALDTVDSLSPVEKISQTNLTAYWKLDETSGTRADSKGGNNLTDTNTVTYAPGRLSNAGQFTAANSEYLSIADNADLSTGDIDFTVAAWVYLDSKPTYMYFLTKSSVTEVEYNLYYVNTDDRFIFQIWNGPLTVVNSVAANNLGSPALGTWYYIVAWHDSVNNQLSIQVNNGATDTLATTTAPTDTASSFTMGRYSYTGDRYVNGRIDEVAFWKRTLTAAERTRLFEDGLDLHGAGSGRIYRTRDTTTKVEGTGSEKLQIGSPQVDASTVGLWHFEETNGTGAYIRDGVPRGFSPDTSNTLTNSLVAYWKLEETSGTRYDSKGGNTLTDGNTVTSNPGKQGTAGQFTAANSEFLSIADNADMSTGDIDFTVTAWVYLDSKTNTQGIAGKGRSSAGTYEYKLRYGSGQDRFQLCTAADGGSLGCVSADNLGAVSTGTWYFIVAWFNASANTINIQVNNGTANSAAGPVPVDRGGEFIIGCEGVCEAWAMDGRIDEVGFWKKVLTAQEKTDLYNSGSGQSYGPNHGTPTGTAAAQGFFGKGRKFNGSQYISIGDSDAFTLSSGFTLEAWIKSTTLTNYDNIIAKYSSASASEYRMEMDGANLFDCTIFDNNTGAEGYRGRTAPYGTTFFNDGRWHHVVCTYDGGTTSASVKIYIDGTQVDSANYQGAGAFTSIRNTAAPLLVGAFTTSSYFFNGTIDEVRVSNTARTAEEIAEAYRAGRDHRLTKTITSTDLSAKTKLPFYVAADRPGTYLEATIGESAYANYEPDANTTGLWHLEEQAGSGAYIKDSSGRGNDFTLTGSATLGVAGKIGKGITITSSTSNYLRKLSASGLPTGTNDFTLGLWFKRNGNFGSTYNSRILTFVNTDSNNGVEFVGQTGNNNVRLQTYGGGTSSVSDYTSASVTDNNWHWIVATRGSSGTVLKVYIDGNLAANNTVTARDFGTPDRIVVGIGADLTAGTEVGAFTFDEPFISNVARTADDIRQAYEIGKRTHPITIDFAARLNAADIAGTSEANALTDTSFVINATSYGAANNGDNLYDGDLLVVRENFNGTEYSAQGAVTSVNATTGAVNVSSLSGTVPAAGTTTCGGSNTHCYSANSTVLKWQREYWDVTGSLSTQRDAVTRVTLRVTDGNEGRTVWLDSINASGPYLTAPAGSTVNSTAQKYYQYRAILSSVDRAVSAYLTGAVTDYKSRAGGGGGVGMPFIF